jgi:hypothetical protein
MPDYTVLLLYPDYIGNDNPRGFETYCGHGTGTPKSAVRQVRKLASSNFIGHEDDRINANDFAVLAVFEGHHNDINPEA